MAVMFGICAIALEIKKEKQEIQRDLARFKSYRVYIEGCYARVGG